MVITTCRSACENRIYHDAKGRRPKETQELKEDWIAKETDKGNKGRGKVDKAEDNRNNDSISWKESKGSIKEDKKK